MCGEEGANAVHSKLGLMAQCGGLPLMSLFTALLSDPLASDSGNRTRELWLSRWECEDVIDHLPNMVIEANFFYLNCGPSQLCRIDMVENLQKVLAGHNFDAAITDGRWVFYDPSGNLVNRQDYFMTANSLRPCAIGILAQCRPTWWLNHPIYVARFSRATRRLCLWMKRHAVGIYRVGIC
nr:hypothetical protein [Molussus totiviridae 1]